MRDAVVECGAVVGVRGNYGFLRCASRPEDPVSHVVFASAVAGGGGGRLDDGGGMGTVRRPRGCWSWARRRNSTWSTTSLRLRGVGSGGGGGGHLAARIVRPQPRGSVVFECAVAAGATSVVEECPSSVGGRRGAGGVAVRVILIDKVVNRDGDKDGNGEGSASSWSCWLFL